MSEKTKEKVKDGMEKTPRSAMEKCKAVLSIWAERRKPSEVCKELAINWGVLSHWQNRAMEGMLQALEPGVNLDQGPALSARLQALLEKRSGKIRPEQANNKLEERLAKIQEARTSSREDLCRKQKKKP